MKLIDIKNILKEINEPNEFQLEPVDLNHPLYWIFAVPNVRIKTLFAQLKEYRQEAARFDVFINGLLIQPADYAYLSDDEGFVIKFIRSRFPTLDRFNNPYELEISDEVKIKGDLELIKK